MLNYIYLIDHESQCRDHTGPVRTGRVSQHAHRGEMHNVGLTDFFLFNLNDTVVVCLENPGNNGTMTIVVTTV